MPRRPIRRRNNPPAAGQAREGQRRWPRWLIGVGLVLLLAAGGGLFALRTLTHRYEHSVIRELLLDPAARRDRASVTGPLNYLLIGTDHRPSARVEDQRSDTIMIAHVPAGLTQAYLISVPRDLLVPIPPSPTTGYLGGSDKINAAFQHGGGGEGGARLLSATLTRLTGVRFDGAALIDFSGFRQVIDLLGGVRMCVDTEVRSIHTQRVFTPGCHQMSGAEALDFARQRYDLPNGDYDRQRHQQQLLRAIMDKAATSNLISDPLRLDQLIRAVGASLTVDTNGVPVEDLAFALRGIRSDALLGIQIPSRPEMIDEVSYVLLEEGAGGLFDALHRADMAGWATTNPRWVNRL